MSSSHRRHNSAGVTNLSRWLLAASFCVTGSALAADPYCPQISTNADLNHKIEIAEDAYGNTDAAGFNTALDQLALDLPCLGEVLTSSSVAGYHRVQGFRLFLNRETDRAKESFAAAYAAGEAIGIYEIPAHLVPAGHPIRKLYEAAGQQQVTYTDLPKPISDTIIIDGTEASQRPNNRAALIQIQDSAGQITASRYLFSSDAVPSYPALAPPPTESTTASIAPVAGAKQSTLRLSLLAGTGTLAAASGIAAGTAFQAQSQFWDTETEHTLSELEGFQKGANRRATLSAALGGAAVLTGGLLVLVW